MSPKAIEQTARIAADATLGAFVVIGPKVTIGAGARIGSHVVIHEGTVVGEGVRIDDHTTIGKQPMRSKMSVTTDGKRVPPCRIGDGVLIGAGVVIYAGCSIGDNVLVADQASVREDVTIGERTIIGRGVAVENRVTIGSRVKVETMAYITAMSRIEDDCFIAPMATFTNDNYMARDPERFRHFGGPHLKRGARVGANATLLPGRVVHEEGVVAAGSIVTSDVEARRVYVGTPARDARVVPDSQLLENQ